MKTFLAVILMILLCFTSSSYAITNGTFDSPIGWKFFTDGAGSFTASGEGKISITTTGTNTQLSQANLVLEPNTNYKLTFKAYSTMGNDLQVSLLKNLTPYTNYGLKQVFDLGTTVQTFEANFRTTGFTAQVSDGRLMFYFPGFAKPGDVYMIDDVTLEKGGAVTPPPPPPPPPPTPLPVITDHFLISLTGLQPGEHCFSVAAFDAAGNESKQSEKICVVLHEETEIFFTPKLFSDTVVGNKRYKTYTMHNKGQKELICNKPSIAGRNASDFSTSFGTDARVAAVGSYLTFRVYFAPTAVGERIASLAIRCNNYSTPVIITLSGNGI